MNKIFYNPKGQTALILVLLAAAALIFLSITLNWGRLAQLKSMVSVAADQSAAMLGSDAASYGQAQKQEYLNDQNFNENFTFAVLLAILAVLLTAATFPFVALWIFVVSLAAAAVTLSLQVAVIQPGYSSIWNKLQRNLPIQEQFYEGGIQTALQAAVTDQANVGDYFDENANGVFGVNGAVPNDYVSRFALFYTDRMKMLNTGDVLPIDTFYNDLSALVNGEQCCQTSSLCGENVNANTCASTDLFNFQLHDACPSDTPGSPGYNPAAYNPYCDVCCQMNPPSSCGSSGVSYPAQCLTDNPYGNGHALIYDPSYQQYTDAPVNNVPGTANPANAANVPSLRSNTSSFLDQFGRDQQMASFATLTPEPQGNPKSTLPIFFPNGVYPLFWLMKDYHPQVSDISSTTDFASTTDLSQHWCVGGSSPWAGVTIKTLNSAADTAIATAFPDLAQLTLGYACSGPDCCINYLPDNTGTTTATTNGPIDLVGSPKSTYNDDAPLACKANDLSNPALDPNFAQNCTGANNDWLQGDNQFCAAQPAWPPAVPNPPPPPSWPYNASTSAYPDGTCEWTGNDTAPGSTTPTAGSTVDSVDDVMHTLSDFDTFAQTFLSKNLTTLNSTFDTWYPSVAAWIAPACNCTSANSCLANPNGNVSICNPGGEGRLLSIYAPADYPGGGYGFVVPNAVTPAQVNKFRDWNKVLTNWLNIVYTPQGATSADLWCVPDQNADQLNGSAEEAYIKNYVNNYVLANNISTTPDWGSLLHVVACLDYNAGQGTSFAPTPFQFNGDSNVGSPANNYTACQTYLKGSPAAKPAGTACDPDVLGRSLVTQPATAVYPNAAYSAWIGDNATLFQNEQPKFALRAAYLSDVYNRAQTMQTISAQADIAMQNFLAPCCDATCDAQCGSGATATYSGPAARLMYAQLHPSNDAVNLPNSVIYGWVDKTLANGQSLSAGQSVANGGPEEAGGYAHLVKVTAYSPGRNGQCADGSQCQGNNQCFDGSACESGSAPLIANPPNIQSQLPWVHRYNSVFEQKAMLNDRDGYVYVSVERWDQNHPPSLFPNNHTAWQFAFNNPADGTANAGNLFSDCTSPSTGYGYGLQAETTQGLNFAPRLQQDKYALQNAFMLNDSGNGQVDANAGSEYKNSCMSKAEQLLATGVESHACVQYVADSKCVSPSATTGGNSTDYCLRFVDCDKIDGGTLPSSNP